MKKTKQKENLMCSKQAAAAAAAAAAAPTGFLERSGGQQTVNSGGYV